MSRTARAAIGSPLALVLLWSCVESAPIYDLAPRDASRPIFSDDFEAPELDPRWRAAGRPLRPADGVLALAGLRNQPLWLDVPLPSAFRVELRAWPTTPSGDLKVELCGDGQDRPPSDGPYVASGYVLVYGGWDDSLSAIIRRDEHGGIGATAPGPVVEPGRPTRFRITYEHGAITWERDGAPFLAFLDPDPICGSSEPRYLGLSGFQAPVVIDSIALYASEGGTGR